MEELSKESIEVINKILSDQRTLNSDCIDLYHYSNTISPENATLNDVYHYLMENDFVTSNAQYSHKDKFLVRFTPEGRKLHKAGSLKKYYDRDQSAEKKILNYLATNNHLVTNRIIQSELSLDEKDCKANIDVLKQKGYVSFMLIHDGDFWQGIQSEITSAGRLYLSRLNSASKEIHFTSNTTNYQTINTSVNGFGHTVNVAGTDIVQSDVSIAIEQHLDRLIELGLDVDTIDKMKQVYYER